VKKLPEKNKQRVIRFLEGKQEDYVANMVELYQEMEQAVKLKKDPQLMMNVFDRLMKLYQLQHGDKEPEESVDFRDLYEKMGEQLKEIEQDMKKTNSKSNSKKKSKSKSKSKSKKDEKDDEPKDGYSGDIPGLKRGKELPDKESES